MRNPIGLVGFLLLGGCGIWQTPVGELRLEAEGAGDDAVVAVVQGADTVWASITTVGSEAWGIPHATQLTLLRARHDGVAARLPGRCWAVVGDSLVWVLIDDGRRFEWIGVDAQGNERVRLAARGGPEGAEGGIPVIGVGWWLFAGRQGVWTYEREQDQWKRVADQVAYVAGDPIQELAAWVRREGMRGALYRVWRSGSPLWLTAVEQPESAQVWILPDGRIALAEQHSERETRVRVWRADGGLESDRRFPAPVSQVAILVDGDATVPVWLDQQDAQWRLRRLDREKPIATLPAGGDATLHSAYGWWWVVTGGRLVVGDLGGVHAQAEVDGSVRLVASLGASALLATGRRIQLWRLSAVPLVRRALVGLGYGLGVGGVALLFGIAGYRIWRAALRRAVFRFLQRGMASSPSRIVELRPNRYRADPSLAVKSQVGGGQPKSVEDHRDNLPFGRPVERPAAAQLRLERLGQQWWLHVPLGARWEWQLELTQLLEEQQIRLAGVLAHELYGELNWLDRAFKEGDRERMGQVLRRLRSRIESARSLARSAPAQAWTEVRDLWAQLSEAYGDLVSSGVLRLIQPPFPLFLEGDRRWLFHVLANLVENAWRAVRGKEDAQIIVLASPQSSWVLIELCDNGPGIAEAVEPGLGMRIVRELVDAQGGRVEWGNNPEGGARVRLWFRRKQSTAHG
ncbi:MAG: HAMP domain-containing histidine kinase [Candidatus Kapabacteria bacterium]|nr:HAMP domain-containing histidine kinase [Candidatus Kapabacteria bacterium]MDW8012468.1 HAMP domain-containing sensor histidine kinase [Bacteroidota bacterium]